MADPKFNAILAGILAGSQGGPATFRSLALAGGVIDAGATGTFGWFTNAVHDSGGFRFPGSAGFHTIGVGTVTFSGTTGSVTATFSSTSNGVLSGVAGADVGKEIRLGNCGLTAEVTASTTSTTSCTVTITNGTVQSGFAYGATITGVGNVKTMIPWRWGIGLDANGYPKYASWLTLTATGNDGNDGQLPAGTYYGNLKATSASVKAGLVVSGAGSYVSAGTPTVSTGGGTITFVSQTFDGTYYNTQFSLVVGSGAQNTTMLAFSGAPDGGVDINRTSGLGAYTPSTPEFWPATVAYHAQLPMLRTLGIVQGIGAGDTTWDTRVPNFACVSSQFGAGGRQLAWETICRLCTALVAAGGNFRTLWTNTPYGALTQADGVTQAQDYARNLGLLFNANLPASVQDENEFCNENWNSSVNTSNGLSIYLTQQYLAGIETLLVTNNALYGKVSADRYLSTLTRNGTTATATLKTALPYGITAGGTYQGFIYSSDSFAIGSPSSLIAMTVSGDGLSISWPDTGTSGTSASTSIAVYLNGASDLLGDGNNSNPAYLSYKYYVRQAFRQQQAMKAVRSGTRWKLCQQTYGIASTPWQGGNKPAGILGALAYYTMADYLGQRYLSAAPMQGMRAWCYAMAVAPYAQVPGTAWGYNGNLTGSGPTIDGSSAATALNSIIGNSGDAATTNSLYGVIQVNQAQVMSAHVYQCVQYGIRPQVYEFNLDVQKMQDAVPTTATFSATISGSTLTLPSAPSTGAKLAVGDYVQCDNIQITQAITRGLAITSNASANADGSGTYTLASSSATISTATPMKTGTTPGALGPLLMADERSGTLIDALMRIWFQSGGKEMCALDFSPNRWDNTHNCWGYAQSVATATESPRYNHLTAFNDVEFYSGILGALGKGSPITWTLATTWQRMDNAVVNTSTTPNVIDVSTSSTLNLQVDQLIMVNDAGSYGLTLSATVNTNGYQVQVWVDESQVGAIPLTNTGVSGTSSGAGAACVTLAPLNVNLTKGPHIISLRVPAGTSGTVGIKTLLVQPNF